MFNPEKKEKADREIISKISMATIWNWLKRIDWWLIICLIFLMLLSLIIVNTASPQSSTVMRQMQRYIIAWTVFLIILLFPSEKIYGITPWVYASTLAVLVFVLLAGDSAGGAKRWINLYIVKLQPSEIAKITVPMMVAWYVTRYKKAPTFPMIVNVIFIIAAPMGLIGLEPDLGTALLVGMSGIFALFLAGVSLWYVLMGGVFSLIGALLYWNFGIHDYQKVRVLTLLNPASDPLGAGYHIVQSKIAIGSGGIGGKGYLHGTQAPLSFLPESNTDFIFSVFAEELGLIGVSLLLSVYLVIILRGIYLSTQLDNRYAKIVVACVFLSFFINVFVNIGMVSGILPVVGLPLALISYGGSSLLSLMAAFALALNLSARYRSYVEVGKVS